MLKFILVGMIRFYQKFISPLTGSHCRYYPTCSEYSLQAIEKKGIIKGLYKATIRILKCNPLFPGGYDPLD